MAQFNVQLNGQRNTDDFYIYADYADYACYQIDHALEIAAARLL